jgi:hypothetical protein
MGIIEIMMTHKNICSTFIFCLIKLKPIILHFFTVY